MATTAPTFSAGGTPSFCAPAKVRILLVPATPLEHAHFERWSSFVRRWEHIKLTDVPRTSRQMPSTPVYEQGEVHLSFVTSHDPAHVYLAPFQLHHVVHGVLGVSSYTRQRAQDLERVPTLLQKQYPNAFVHRVLAFDGGEKEEEAPTGDGDMAAASEPPSQQDDTEFAPTPGFSASRESGVLVCPAVRRDAKDVRFYVRTLLAEFVGAVLDQLDGLVAQLDEHALETPRETLSGAPMLRAVTERRIAPPAPQHRAAATVAAASKMFGLKRRPPTAPPPPTTTFRLTKVKADVALINGYLWDALEMYDSILTLSGKERALAGGHDAVWFAGALEGWAVTRLLVARLGDRAAEEAPCLLYPLTPGKDKEVHEPTPPALAWRDIAEAYSLALTIYSKCLAPPHVQLEALRSMTNETSRDYTPPYVYACACLSYARFLLALFASGGWNSEAHDQLVYGGVPPALDTGVPLTFAEEAHLSAVSGIYRHEVASAASAALTPSLPLLLPSDQLRILTSLHRILTLVRYERRAAHVARVLSTVVCSILARTLRVRALQPNVHIGWDAVRDMLRWHMPSSDSMPRAERTDAGLFAMSNPALVLGMMACDAYGIDILTTPLRRLPPSHILEIARRRVCAHAYTDMLVGMYGAQAAMEWLPALSASAAVARRARVDFGWHALQVQLLKDLIVQCESVDDYLGQVFFAALLLRDFELEGNDRTALIEGLRHALPRAQWHGAPDLALEYWGPKDVLRAVQVEPRPPGDIPTHRTRAELDGAHGDANPFVMRSQTRSAPAASEQLANEPVWVSVTLANPWTVPLPMYDVHLVADGVALDLDRAPPVPVVVVPPTSMHTVRLSVVPTSPGSLSIHGVRVRLWGAEPYTFHISKSVRGSMYPRHASGLLARPGAQLMQYILHHHPKDETQLDEWLTPSHDVLTCRILPPQPRVHAAWDRSSRAPLMLQQGQCTSVKIALHNVSDVPVNVLRLSVEDRWQSAAHDTLAERAKPLADLSELEWQLKHAPVARLEADFDSLAPHASAHAVLHVRGRVGCDCVRVRILYGHDQSQRGSLSVRCALLTLPLSIEPSVDIRPALHIQRIDREPARRLMQDILGRAPELDRDCALISLDVYNASAWRLVVRVDVPPISLEHSLLPATSARLTFPLAQLRLTHAELSQPLPPLTMQQYVVPKTTLSESAEAQARAQFWVRHAFLEHVHISWTNAEKHTNGEVLALRTLWPTPSQMAMLLAPKVSVDVHAAPDGLVDTPMPVSVTVHGPLTTAHAVRIALEPRLGADKARMHVMATHGTWDITFTEPQIEPLTWSASLCFLSEGIFSLAARVDVVWTAAGEPESYMSPVHHVHMT